MKLKQLVLSIALILSINVFAQRGGRKFSDMPKVGIVNGKVIDKTTNKPLEFVSVALFRQKDSTVVTGVITASDGNFTITEVPFGKFYISVTSVGFKKQNFNSIKILPNKKIHDMGVIKLTQSAINLEGVEVVAQRNRVQYKLDKKIINVQSDLASSNKSAVEVLENTPSVDVDMDGEVSLRGSTNFTVLINGRPSVLQGSEALEQIPASTIENIELITNPSAKHDPDGTAGIINIVMKKEKKGGITGLVNADASSNGSYKGGISLNYISSSYSIFSNISYNNDERDGEMKSERRTSYPDNDTIRLNDIDGERNRGRKGYSFKLGSDITLTKKDFLTISGNYGFSERSGERFNKTYNIVNPGAVEAYEISRRTGDDNTDYFSFNTDYVHKFNQLGHQLDLSAYYSARVGDDIDLTNEYFTNNQYTSVGEYKTRKRENEDENSSEMRFKADYTNPINEYSKFEAGFQAILDSENEDLTTENLINNIWQVDSKYTSDFDFTRNIYSAYSTYSNRLGSVDFMLGLRLENTNREFKNNTTGDSYKLDRLDYFPTLHISKQVDKNNQLSASYGRRIHRPRGRWLDPVTRQMDSRTVRVGSPDLEPEYTNSYELSYQYKFGFSFIALEAFYRNTTNIISRTQEYRDEVLYMTFENQDQDHSVGLELMGNFKLGKKFMLNSSISMFNYKLEGESNGEDVVKNTTTYNGRLNLNYSLNKTTKFQLQGFYRGPSVTVNGDRDAMGGINVAVKKDFLKGRLSTTLQVRDVFNTFKYSFSSEIVTKDNDKIVSTTNTDFTFRRDPRVISLSANYKINNFKEKRKKRNGSNGGDMDIEF